MTLWILGMNSGQPSCIFFCGAFLSAKKNIRLVEDLLPNSVLFGSFVQLIIQVGGHLLVLDNFLHQEFQVPKMEGFLYLIFGYFGGGFSLT